MAKSDQWRPRLNIDLTEEQLLKLRELFPWGVQQAFWRAIVDDVIDIVERKGSLAIAAVISKALHSRDISPTLRSLEDLPDDHTQGPGAKVDHGTDD